MQVIAGRIVLLADTCKKRYPGSIQDSLGRSAIELGLRSLHAVLDHDILNGEHFVHASHRSWFAPSQTNFHGFLYSLLRHVLWPDDFGPPQESFQLFYGTLILFIITNIIKASLRASKGTPPDPDPIMKYGSDSPIFQAPLYELEKLSPSTFQDLISECEVSGDREAAHAYRQASQVTNPRNIDGLFSCETGDHFTLNQTPRNIVRQLIDRYRIDG